MHMWLIQHHNALQDADLKLTKFYMISIAIGLVLLADC